MTSKSLFGLLVRTVLLGTGLTITACSGDDALVLPEKAAANYDLGTGGTQLTTVRPEDTSTKTPTEPGRPAAKTVVDEHGDFYWGVGDNIFIDMGAGQWTAAARTNIKDVQARADFYVDQLLTEPSYALRYTGTATSSPLQVRIAAEQGQDRPGLPLHFGEAGDCGVAIATKNTELSEAHDRSYYRFDLTHKSAYLLLTPQAGKNPGVEDAKMVKVEVEDLDGGTLCGLYDFSTGSLSSGPIADGASKVTLTCGKLDFPLTVQNDPESNGMYLVIQPGEHRLRITYHYQTLGIQTQKWENNRWNYTYPAYTEHTVEKELPAFNYQPGRMRRITNKIEIPFEVEFTFQREHTYWRWDAEAWFWDGRYWNWRYDSPGNWHPDISIPFPQVPLSNNDQSLQCLSSISQGYTYGAPGWGNEAYHNQVPFPEAVTDAGEAPPLNPLSWRRPGNINAVGTHSAATMPTANEMTWYLQYGRPHYDKTTTWYLKGYRDGSIACRGGVWLLKKEKWKDAAGNPVTPDFTKVAPMFRDMQYPGTGASQYDLHKGGYPTKPISRYYTKADPNVPSHATTLAAEYGYNPTRKPGDGTVNGSEDINDYFFLPFLGYYLDEQVGSSPLTARMTQKLVGVRGFYWSNTPQVYPTSDVYHDGYTENTDATWNAYYFYADEIYCGVEWKGNNGQTKHVARFGKVAGLRPDGTRWFQ